MSKLIATWCDYNILASKMSLASHKHLHHWVFLIDAQVNDYEEDNAEYGKQRHF